MTTLANKDATSGTSSCVSYECHSLLFFTEMMKSADLDSMSDDDSACENDSEDEEDYNSAIDPIFYKTFQGCANKSQEHEDTCKIDIPSNRESDDEENNGDGKDSANNNSHGNNNPISGPAKLSHLPFERCAIEKLVQRGKIIECNTVDDSCLGRFRFVRFHNQTSQPRYFTDSQA